MPSEGARTEILAEVKAEKLSGLETERRARDWENRDFRETVSQNARVLREVRARSQTVERLGADTAARAELAELEELRAQVERLASG